MVGLMQRIDRREQAARARVERLREEAARVAGELAEAEEELRRLAITPSSGDDRTPRQGSSSQLRRHFRVPAQNLTSHQVKRRG